MIIMTSSISKKLWAILVITGIALPFAFSGWKALYDGFLERGLPVIKIRDLPRGIGILPVSLKLSLIDSGTGLDEVVVRTEQKHKIREIYRQSLGGEIRANIEVQFPGINSKLEEGPAAIEIKAFDRSFWSNVTTKRIELYVDYHKPKIEVLTTQHNARQGGSQLVIYKAFDEDLYVSGVKVNNNTFYGFPAKKLDPSIIDDSVFVGLFAVDLLQDSNPSIKVFAEDRVGNVTSATFYNKVLRRNPREVGHKVSDEFLRSQIADLASQNLTNLETYYKSFGKKIDFKAKRGTIERSIEEFKLVNQDLRKYDEAQIDTFLKKYNENQALSLNRASLERQWSNAFGRPGGTTQRMFGENVAFSYQDQALGKAIQLGDEIRKPLESEVEVSNNGIVVFSDSLGFYGKTVIIDHGLGLVSIYSRLNRILAKEGDRVEKGDIIGLAGESGFALWPEVYYEMRIQGVPVDPREWWDGSWLDAQIEGKLGEVKRSLGIANYLPLK